ncbi:Uncharacterised protein [Plesiomonas shigelloides]|nr:Uncharacterised protein [Plesiomonas shigelloides]
MPLCLYVYSSKFLAELFDLLISRLMMTRVATIYT